MQNLPEDFRGQCFQGPHRYICLALFSRDDPPSAGQAWEDKNGVRGPGAGGRTTGRSQDWPLALPLPGYRASDMWGWFTCDRTSPVTCPPVT